MGEISVIQGDLGHPGRSRSSRQISVIQADLGHLVSYRSGVIIRIIYMIIIISINGTWHMIDYYNMYDIYDKNRE